MACRTVGVWTLLLSLMNRCGVAAGPQAESGALWGFSCWHLPPPTGLVRSDSGAGDEGGRYVIPATLIEHMAVCRAAEKVRVQAVFL
jgi:hypothetical protein